MTKTTVIEMHEMIDARLFGSRWLADKSECKALSDNLTRLGLQEVSPGKTDTWRTTALGDELQVDLAMVFIGLYHEHEAPSILASYGLIEERDVDRIWCGACS